ncbi:MAG: diphthine synthase [Nanoarchaeota archaeon]|nr:diphthine synthase [Nanoarchaeota archaeon]
MALYLIGLGLGDERDITIKGLSIIKQARKIYLDVYTSQLQVNIDTLASYYGKNIIAAGRDILENNMEQIIEEARKEDVALLIIGSPTAATTHFTYLLEAKKKNVDVHIIENASIFSAIGITGLFLYKFGTVVSIPRDNNHLETPYQNYLNNQKQGNHTLFLLDTQDKPLTAREGLDYLLSKGLPTTTTIIGCAALGSEEPELQTGTAATLQLQKYPQCFIIPGKLHYLEEEALEFWKNHELP